MKVITVLGTRPEIIRLSRIIQKLERMGIRMTLLRRMTEGQRAAPEARA